MTSLRPTLPFLLLLLALAAPRHAQAHAATEPGQQVAPPQAAQAQAAGGPALQVARTQAAQARTQLAEVRSRQTALRAELNTLAARIETLKAQRQGKLSAGDELEAALRRSQELSGELTQLAQALASADSTRRTRERELHAALSAELLRLRAAWEATPEREARAQLLSRMRTLRAEREGVRAALPGSELPALAASEGASDDPEELLEQADALRDSRDKVRLRLRALQGHIAELREARDLERRMVDFLGDEAMFDEQDRRMRLRRTGDSALRVERTAPSGGQGGDLEFADPSPTVGSPAPAQPPPAAPSPPGSGAPEFDSPPVTPATGAPPPSSSASDVRPLVGGIRAQALAGGSPEDLPALEREAARLEGLAHELEARAAALEAQGRTR